MQDADQDELTILYTNDLHSHFDVMGRISAMVEEQRAACKDATSTLLLDIGDHMDRAAPETEGTMGQANVDILNLMRYDAITIGNNEGLTFTPELLNQAYAGLICPVVCGNIRELGKEQPPSWMMEDLIVQKGNITIGLVGATVAYAEFYELLGLEALDPKLTIMNSVERLRSRVDLIIVMSHMGLPFDKELAEEVSGIDLIIGGHTHHLLEEPLFIGRTAITAAGKFGRYLGRVVFKRDYEQGRFVVTEGNCIPVEEGAEDGIILRAISIHKKQAEERMQRTVAVTDRTLPIEYNVESPFGNLLAQAVRRYTHSEISIVNSGQLLADLPAGEISEGMLHERCPSPINPCRMSLTGEDILYTLEQSLLQEFNERVIYGFGFRGKVLGGICVDGMEIIYDLDRLPYNRILQASVHGVPILPEKVYDVGTLDMFSFGIGYERLKNGNHKQFMLPDFLRDLLRMELQTPGAVSDCYLSRWRPS
ncbi:bifunctional metallophosphatase/5'-nucleotidase [Paenibacillus segetis]|uniref:bifunctional metallophosphatase/5'-nucleotidase n=1 Tax=Paenibacillus segetis TaxID=1325360 RepID=UPI003571338A